MTFTSAKVEWLEESLIRSGGIIRSQGDLVVLFIMPGSQNNIVVGEVEVNGEFDTNCEEVK